MTIEFAQRIAIDFLNANSVSENVNEAIRFLVNKTMSLTVEDIINKLSNTTYINLIDSGHSVAYCKANQLNDNLKRRYVKSINGESKYSIQIHLIAETLDIPASRKDGNLASDETSRKIILKEI